MISDNYVPLRQLGNGVTVAFSASWNMLAASYARVFFEDTTTGVQTEQLTGWSISLAAGGAGWTVTFVTPPASTVYVVIGRSVTLDQTDPYRTSRGWQGAVVEASFDKLTAVCQDISDVAARSIVFPLGDTATVTLPAASQRANLALVFDASGNATAGASTSATVSAAMIPVVGAASLAAARTAMGVQVAGSYATLTGAEALTNKSVNGVTLTTGGSASQFLNGVGTYTAAGVFTSSFTSTDQTITAAGALTLAHSLGVAPKLVRYELVCQTNEAGFTAGQVIDANWCMGTTTDRGLSAILDATNITIRYGFGASTFQANHATTGVGTALTNANWKLRVKAWA